MDIAAGIGAVSSALTIAQTLRGIDKSYGDATYKAQLAELIVALADAKLAMAEAKEDLAGKDKEIERLKASFEAHSALVKGNGDYSYFADDNGKPLGYPICPKCQQVDGRVIQLKQEGASINAKCPACATVYNPVSCYLPHGSGHETKEAKESADWSASITSAGRRTSYY